MEKNAFSRSFPITVKDISAVLFVPGEEDGTRKVYRGNCIPYQLVYTLEGEVELIFDYKTYTEKTDTLRFTPKGRVNANYEVTTVKKGACIDVCFDTAEPIMEDCFVTDCSGSKKLRGLFLGMERLWRTEKNRYYPCMAMLYRILDELCCPDGGYLPKRKEDIIAPAVEYIHENFTRSDLDYPMLAKRCGISEAYLRKLFNARFGVPPHRYVINMRIDYACDLLGSGMYSVGEVARMCGCDNVFYFSKLFRQTMGLSPSMYRSGKLGGFTAPDGE